MAIKSYLAHPHRGQKEKLINELSALKNCEIIPAENKDVIVLITDTESDFDDDILKQHIETFNSLKILALVSGFNTPKNDL
jgi:nitrate reductase NapAB chaperone NapD